MVWDQLDFEKLSPMMQHYVSTKRAYPDAIIMYRVGDFFEMFFDDALTASKILELALTGKDCGLEERAPMCGVPQQVIESYSTKLVEAGHRVAIVDQVEDPKEAVGLVKRSVTRLLTPGTVTDNDSLDQKENNFLLSLYFYNRQGGFCFADLSTGQIQAAEEEVGKDRLQFTVDWIHTIGPSEILLIDDPKNQRENDLLQESLSSLPVFISRIQVDPKESSQSLDLAARYLGPSAGKVLKGHLLASLAAASLLSYVYAFQEDRLSHLNQLTWLSADKYMTMNASTRENLELNYNLYNHSKKGTLFSVLDHTQTAMGSRLLHQWLDFPLIDPKRIERRQDFVQAFLDQLTIRIPLREALCRVYDLERLLGKFSYNRGNARDLLALSTSLDPLPEIQETLMKSKTKAVQDLGGGLDLLEDIKGMIDQAIVEDPPILITEGGLIRPGFDEDLDRLRQGSDQAREDLLTYEARERERTGIKNLRIIYRKNNGYFIEITNSNKDRVPENYRRRQTLKNAERYTTDYLETQEGKITGDESQIQKKEYEIFQRIREKIAGDALRLQETARTLAKLDVLLSFADQASEWDYCRPQFTKKDLIQIVDGRHPVVEKQLEGAFIPNTLEIGEKTNRIEIITGPNMAGKSTYMRQNALILIMAQMGSFVPAKSCLLPVTDQIFTRIGARDHLARGESTFMVEMKEMAEILSMATEKSFLVLDEVGRGTSTNDGMAIAYAILEYLSRHLRAKTLFATHYHELTTLAKKDNPISNRKVDIRERDGKLVFLRKVVEGQADRSYGIEVARLSGLPQEILDRAQFLLVQMEAEDKGRFVQGAGKTSQRQQDFSDFQKDAYLQKITAIDINRLSPVEAMVQLSQLIEEAGAILRKDNL